MLTIFGSEGEEVHRTVELESGWAMMVVFATGYVRLNAFARPMRRVRAVRDRNVMLTEKRVNLAMASTRSFGKIMGLAHRIDACTSQEDVPLKFYVIKYPSKELRRCGRNPATQAHFAVAF